jgi:hypothetical protein
MGAKSVYLNVQYRHLSALAWITYYIVAKTCRFSKMQQIKLLVTNYSDIGKWINFQKMFQLFISQ